MLLLLPLVPWVLQTVLFMEHLVYAGHCDKFLSGFISLRPYNNTYEIGIIIIAVLYMRKL